MAAFPKRGNNARLWKLLARKNQRDIPLLVMQRHAIGKGPLPRDPTHVNTLCAINPGAANVKWLVAKGFHHFEQLALSARSWKIRDQTDDSWQFSSLKSLSLQLKLMFIPSAPPGAQFRRHRFRHSFSQSTVQTHG